MAANFGRNVCQFYGNKAHNGEFLISTPEGRQLLTGTIPLEQMQTYKFESLEVKADTAPAEEPEQPIKVNEHMQDLVGIEDFTYG